MSRPIVLARKHPVIWTAAYPTVTVSYSLIVESASNFYQKMLLGCTFETRT